MVRSSGKFSAIESSRQRKVLFSTSPFFCFCVANSSLGIALKPEIEGIPPGLFSRCLGICILSVVEAGFIFSGNLGTGIVMARSNGKWGNPVAIGMTGVGFGLLAGGSLKDILIFIFDNDSLGALVGDVGMCKQCTSPCKFRLSHTDSNSLSLSLSL